MLDFFKTIRTVSLIFLAGSATGAYGAWRHSTTITDDIQARMVEGGWCAQADPRKVVYLFACRDVYHAEALQQRDAEVDAEVNTILSDMAKREPKAKTVKASAR